MILRKEIDNFKPKIIVLYLNYKKKKLRQIFKKMGLLKRLRNWKINLLGKRKKAKSRVEFNLPKVRYYRWVHQTLWETINDIFRLFFLWELINIILFTSIMRFNYFTPLSFVIEDLTLINQHQTKSFKLPLDHHCQLQHPSQ